MLKRNMCKSAVTYDNRFSVDALQRPFHLDKMTFCLPSRCAWLILFVSRVAKEVAATQERLHLMLSASLKTPSKLTSRGSHMDGVALHKGHQGNGEEH